MSTNSVEKEKEEEVSVPAQQQTITSNEIKGATIERVTCAPPIDFSIKHPLQNSWTLWYYENIQKLSWNERLRKITSFQTVEDFWCIHNHIRSPSKQKDGTDYSIFKTGITPAWEHECNKQGGIWKINIDKRNRDTVLDQYWLDLILCMIGETFEQSDQVCGATVSLRKGTDRIGLWTKYADDAVANREIGKTLRERLVLSPEVALLYVSHETAAVSSNNRNQKALYEC